MQDTKPCYTRTFLLSTIRNSNPIGRCVHRFTQIATLIFNSCMRSIKTTKTLPTGWEYNVI